MRDALKEDGRSIKDQYCLLLNSITLLISFQTQIKVVQTKKENFFSVSHNMRTKDDKQLNFFRLLCLIPNCSIIITIKTCCNRSPCSTTFHTQPICVRLLCTLETEQKHLLNDKSKEEFNFRLHINYDNGTKDLWNLLFSLIDSAQTEELQSLYFSPSVYTMFTSEIELCTMHKHIIVQMSIHDFSQE